MLGKGEVREALSWLPSATSPLDATKSHTQHMICNGSVSTQTQTHFITSITVWLHGTTELHRLHIDIEFINIQTH